MGNFYAGFLLLCCQWISAILIGLWLGFLNRGRVLVEERKRKKSSLPFSAALVQGVQSGIQGMLSVIGYVLLFSAIIELFFTFFGRENPLILLIAGLLEVTTGCIHTAAGGDLVLIGFFVSFSGLSVFFQAISFFKEKDFSFFPFPSRTRNDNCHFGQDWDSPVSPDSMYSLFQFFSSAYSRIFSNTHHCGFINCSLCGIFTIPFCPQLP